MLGTRTYLLLFLATIVQCQENTIQSVDGEQRSNPSSRIVGGQIVSNRSEFAYQALLRWASGNVPFCGASIIDHRNLLTAASCVVSNGTVHAASSMQAVVGGLIVNVTSASTVVEQIRHVFVHSQYNNITGENDIAVLRIDNLTLNQDVALVPLSTQAVYPMCVVSGWGTLFSGGPPSQSLRFALVPLVPLIVCNITYQSLFPTNICAGMYRAGACDIDTGGPLVCNQTQVGIFSWSKGCGDADFPGVYTSIPHHLTWINQQMVTDGSDTLFVRKYLILVGIIAYILTKRL